MNPATPASAAEAQAQPDCALVASPPIRLCQESRHDVFGSALHALNKSAEGQKAAIQIGNQYAEVLNEQLISLRYLLHLQIQQQQEFMQVEHSVEAADQARAAHANVQEAEVKP